MLFILEIYLQIGLLWLFARLGYDGIMYIRKMGMRMAAARGTRVLPALLVLAVGATYLLAMCVICWPFSVRRIYLNWRAK